MIHCAECKYHEDVPIDEIYDPLTNEEWTIWGMYCNKHDKEYEFDHTVRFCKYYTPYNKTRTTEKKSRRGGVIRNETTNKRVI